MDGFGHVGLDRRRHVVNAAGAQRSTGWHPKHQQGVLVSGVPSRTSERVFDGALNAAGDRAEARTDAARLDIPVVADEVVAQAGGRQPGDVDAEHRHELIGDLLAECPHRDRRGAAQIALETELEMRRAFGFKRLAGERRERALRREPDAVVAGRQKLLGARARTSDETRPR